MHCRSCGAVIAAKAIVCYKCGTPTAELAEVPRSAPPESRVRTIGLLLAVAAGVTALAVWLVPKTPEGSWMRYAAWAAVPVLVFLLTRLIPGRRSSRLRRR